MIVMKLAKEQRELLVNNIQSYLQDEWSQEVGELAAGNLLEFMTKQLGPLIYNQAIDDARGVVLAQVERIEEEVYSLQQPIERLR